MSLAPQVDVWAAASVLNTGVVSFAMNSGKFASVTRAGAGDVTVNLGTSSGVDATERAVLLSINSTTADDQAQLDPASGDNALRILTFRAGVAADIPFSIVVLRKRPF